MDLSKRVAILTSVVAIAASMSATAQVTLVSPGAILHVGAPVVVGCSNQTPDAPSTCFIAVKHPAGVKMDVIFDPTYAGKLGDSLSFRGVDGDGTLELVPDPNGGRPGVKLSADVPGYGVISMQLNATRWVSADVNLPAASGGFAMLFADSLDEAQPGTLDRIGLGGAEGSLGGLPIDLGRGRFAYSTGRATLSWVFFG